VPSLTAEIPIIVMPNELILSSPDNSQQVRYMKFSKSQAAARYVHAVKSSSSNIGLSVGGFLELFVGDISGSYATRSDEGKGKIHILLIVSSEFFRKLHKSQNHNSA
jgi:hypothetical protein